MTRRRMFPELSGPLSQSLLQKPHPVPPPFAEVPASSRALDEPSKSRELPDVTGFLVVVIVALGLFVVPVGATIMQGPAIVASLFSGR
jgi:hypothetical protein